VFNIPGVNVVIVGKILEGALEGDMVKVRSYAELAIEKLEGEGKYGGASILRSKLDGSYKNSPNIVIMDNGKKINLCEGCLHDDVLRTYCTDCHDFEKFESGV
jgi:hypothetical protein